MIDRKQELRNSPIGPLLFKYSLPAMIGMMVNALYNIVDTMFIGHGAGEEALAAMTICFPIQMFILAVGHLVGIGAASIISRRLGAGDHDTANKTAGTAMVVVSILGILLTIISLAFLTPIVKLFGATDLIIPYCRDYLGVVMLGALFFSFTSCTNNIARSEGSAKLAMTCMILGALTNAALDPIFIFDWGLGMGIRGAALATVIANFVTFVFMITYFVKRQGLVKVHLKDLKIYWHVLPEMFAIGMSSFSRVMAGSLAAIVINNAINAVGEHVHLAILGVSTRVIMFFAMPMIGVVQGLQPILGFNFGAGEMGRAKYSYKLAVKSVVIYCLAIFTIIQVFAEQIVSLFGNDVNLLTEGPMILKIMTLCIPMIGFSIVGESIFQAIGKAAMAFFLSMARQVLVLVPLAYFMAQLIGIAGIWISYPISDIFISIIIALVVHREMKLFDSAKPIVIDSGT